MGHLGGGGGVNRCGTRGGGGGRGREKMWEAERELSYTTLKQTQTTKLLSLSSLCHPFPTPQEPPCCAT